MPLAGHSVFECCLFVNIWGKEDDPESDFDICVPVFLQSVLEQIHRYHWVKQENRTIKRLRLASLGVGDIALDWSRSPVGPAYRKLVDVLFEFNERQVALIERMPRLRSGASKFHDLLRSRVIVIGKMHRLGSRATVEELDFGVTESLDAFDELLDTLNRRSGVVTKYMEVEATATSMRISTANMVLQRMVLALTIIITALTAVMLWKMFVP